VQVLHKFFRRENTLVSVDEVDCIRFLIGKLSGSRIVIRKRAAKIDTAEMLNTI